MFCGLFSILYPKQDQGKKNGKQTGSGGMKHGVMAQNFSNLVNC